MFALSGVLRHKEWTTDGGPSDPFNHRRGYESVVLILVPGLSAKNLSLLAARKTVFLVMVGRLSHEFLIKQAGGLYARTVIELARHIEIVNAANCR